jgi:PAS domain S-box-containing protein
MTHGGTSLRQTLTRSFRVLASSVGTLLVLVTSGSAIELVYVAPTLQETTSATRAVRQLHEGMVDEETGIRGYLLATPGTALRFLQPYTSGRAAVALNRHAALRAAAADPELRELLATMNARSAEWESGWAAPAVSGRVLPPDELGAFLDRGKKLFDSYRDAESRVITMLIERQDRALSIERTTFSLSLLLTLSLGGLVVFGLARQRRRLAATMVDPVARLATGVQDIRYGRALDLDDDLLKGAAGRRGAAPTELRGLATDIGDMARALLARDAELRRSRSVLVEAERLAELGSWEWDANLGTSSWSRQMHAIAGTDPDSDPPSGGISAILDLTHPQDRDVVAATVGRLLAVGGTDSVSHRLLRGDGSLRHVTSWVQVTLDPDGTPTRVTGSVQDVTARTEADRALAASELRYRLITDNSSDLITRQSASDGRFTFVSAAARTLLGLEPEVLLGAGRLPVHPEDADALRTGQRHVLDGGGESRWTYRVQHADQSWIWVETVATVVRDHNGGAELHAATRDISARIEAEAALVAARDAALAATAAKSAFLATMSHEVRTPMNAVIGMTELLLDTGLDPQQREYAETVRASGDALLGTINDILDFSKIEAGELRLESAPFDLHACVEGAVDLVAALPAAQRLHVAALLDPACPRWVTGDVTRLRQILVNLVGNAVKFTGEGDVLVTVDIDTDTDTDADTDALSARDRPSTMDSQRAIRVSVADTGIGIAPERMGALFRAFSQVDESTTRLYGGTGLGLAISHRLVEAMGGALTATSAVGVGTTFTFTARFGVPPSQNQPSENPPSENPPSENPPPGFADRGQTRQPPGGGPPLRILLAEDNAVNQRVGQLMLGKLGHRVDVVTNGADAVQALRNVEYDVVLMDVHMPEMDGLAATRLIRSEFPPDRQPRIIAMTASALVTDRNACATAGMDDYLAKPVRQRDLVRALGAAHLTEPLEDTPAPLDPGMFEALVDQLGNRSSRARDALIDTYVDQAESSAAELRAMAAGSDLAAVAELASALRSSSLLVGALPLSALSDRMERACAGGAADEVPALVHAMTAELARVREAFRRIRTGDLAR